MSLPAIDDIVTANILIGGGATKPCQVKVLGYSRTYVRVEMVTGAPEVDLPVGAQTILSLERFA